MAMEFIKVNEKLPEPGEIVLCYFDGLGNKYRRQIKKEQDEISPTGHSLHHVVRQLVSEKGVRWADEGVTHWCPIPEPPK